MVQILRDFYKYLKAFESDVGRGIYLSFFFTILAGLAEGLGISLLLPLFQIFNTQESKSQFGLANFLLNILNKFNIEDSYGIIFFLIITAFLIKGFLIFLAFSYNSLLKGKLMKSLKKRLFNNYSKMSYEYYLQIAISF